mmetsp:Transcript_5476/g.9842  ORF Transcript_5476/g.9842 Transcript_5476/m.9842 type:complete len:366 (-) Transcript_5476:243-1340(-)|eukprot:CAMPEP_0184509218 /NCGR_PEP_ID=MMETSP0198_2-20121128/1169_1 /TAXON_ID=1112570 /ORGANISM="Thraustochytrium sp., Strain LLF1b" /LENGTH=365 /DNA_ID=CAMNT_0026899039 /DNA_START=255 /DNA_END=1352 /DNA_ORIENTATION=-
MSGKTVRRVFSGIQASGVPTLGNYLGALRNWVKLQDLFASVASKEETPLKEEQEDGASPGRVLYMLADLHSLTTVANRAQQEEAIMGLTSTLLACGISPDKAALFQQSGVSAHSELAWILQCNTPMGWLNRMTQFKDKSDRGQKKDKLSLGLYTYPTLMAADILLYQASHIPVGHDQTQHIEFTRDIALRMNDRFSTQMFSLPQAVVPQGGVDRVMSLTDGRKKMSKSDPLEHSRILLSDSAEVIATKIRRAKSDSLGTIGLGDKAGVRPEVFNMIYILSTLTQREVNDVLTEFDGKMISTLKAELTEAVIAKICPIGEEINRLNNDKPYVASVLRRGNQTANEIAELTMAEVKEAVGITPFKHY